MPQVSEEVTKLRETFHPKERLYLAISVQVPSVVSLRQLWGILRILDIIEL